MSKSSLITGITGQDGRYLSSLLVDMGHTVYGLVRSTNKQLPKPLIPIYGDLLDLPPLPKVDEVYNLAALSFVGESFRTPELTYQTNAVGAIRLMEWAAKIGARFYQASTSEMYGNTGKFLDENSPMKPVSPYGIAKLAAHRHAQTLRERGHFVACGILFNHESPLRGHQFVTRKITDAAKRREPVVLGNLDVQRDWGRACDYVHGMHAILNHSEPDDFVLATGVQTSLRLFAARAYGLNWTRDLDQYVSQSAEYMRPSDITCLRGNAKKATTLLHWWRETSIEAVVADMMSKDDTGEFWPEWLVPSRVRCGTQVDERLKDMYG